MPRFDKTGPMGAGPMTGRGFGPCGFGLGWRQRFGAGRGMGRYFGWRWPQSKDEELKALTDYQAALKEELDDVAKELEETKKA